MTKRSILISALVLLLTITSLAAQTPPTPSSAAPPCDIASAAPWIDKWFEAWNLTSTEILRIGAASRFDFVFYDATCVYTNNVVAGEGGVAKEGPGLHGARYTWLSKPHQNTLTLPNATTLPVALMSFASGDKKTGPFFVMAAPSYWEATLKKTDPHDFTAVFLHEFSHVRQVSGFEVIGKLEETWKFQEDFDDNMVQNHFKSNEEYVKAFNVEHDLLYRAAAAESTSEVRSLATEALKMIKARHARYFVGNETVFATLDSVWLSLEGAGQWTAYAWLSHPKGGGLTRDEALEKMRGRRRQWSQDEGLGLFLVVDRLLPEWPALVFAKPSIGAVELLDRALRTREMNTKR